MKKSNKIFSDEGWNCVYARLSYKNLQNSNRIFWNTKGSKNDIPKIFPEHFEFLLFFEISILNVGKDFQNIYKTFNVVRSVGGVLNFTIVEGSKYIWKGIFVWQILKYVFHFMYFTYYFSSRSLYFAIFVYLIKLFDYYL